jgi:DNA-binding response OmpR family regulator
MDGRASVLILDDDPSHLRIYGWIVEAAGYAPLATLVRVSGFELPDKAPDLVLLDYHLAGKLTAVQVATEIRAKMPGVPIVVLSDALVLPDDVAPLVNDFVRKGDPGKLVYTLQQQLGR